MSRLLLVLLGGATGSGLRYLLGLWTVHQFTTAFPLSTLTVNVVGSFAIGLVATIADERLLLGGDWRAFLVPGLLGGFTTFSSFSLEAFRLVEREDVAGAAMYIGGNLLLGAVAVVAGVALGRNLA